MTLISLMHLQISASQPQFLQPRRRRWRYSPELRGDAPWSGPIHSRTLPLWVPGVSTALSLMDSCQASTARS